MRFWKAQSPWSKSCLTVCEGDGRSPGQILTAAALQSGLLEFPWPHPPGPLCSLLTSEGEGSLHSPGSLIW